MLTPTNHGVLDVIKMRLTVPNGSHDKQGWVYLFEHRFTLQIKVCQTLTVFFLDQSKFDLLILTSGKLVIWNFSDRCTDDTDLHAARETKMDLNRFMSWLMETISVAKLEVSVFNHI